MPVAVSAYFVHQYEIFEDMAGLGYIAAIVMFTVMAFGFYRSPSSRLVQAVAILTVLGSVATEPAGLTNSPEHAQASACR